MREDESLRNEYERDLGLIVGETDRLSQSVTQLLSFARKESPAGQPLSVDELVRSVADLFRANAREQGIALDCEVSVQAELAGKSVSALRDALSNLLLNALQATPQGGRVALLAAAADWGVVQPVGALDGLDHLSHKQVHQNGAGGLGLQVGSIEHPGLTGHRALEHVAEHEVLHGDRRQRQRRQEPEPADGNPGRAFVGVRS